MAVLAGIAALSQGDWPASLLPIGVGAAAAGFGYRLPATMWRVELASGFLILRRLGRTFRLPLANVLAIRDHGWRLDQNPRSTRNVYSLILRGTSGREAHIRFVAANGMTADKLAETLGGLPIRRPDDWEELLPTLDELERLGIQSESHAPDKE